MRRQTKVVVMSDDVVVAVVVVFVVFVVESICILPCKRNNNHNVLFVSNCDNVVSLIDCGLACNMWARHDRRTGLLAPVVRLLLLAAAARQSFSQLPPAPPAPAPRCNSLGLHFYDWDGLQSSTPYSYSLPQTEAEIASIVTRARNASETVKVIGGGLSFSGVQMVQSGHTVSLDRMKKILSVEYPPQFHGGALVEVEAGWRVRDLVHELATFERPQTLLNLGATATQSIAGATSTSTHGTGAAIGSMATQIQAMRIIDATGQVHVLSLIHI